MISSAARVLIVDDDHSLPPKFRDAFRELERRSRLRVDLRSTDSPHKAIELAERGEVDVLVVDLGLPAEKSSHPDPSVGMNLVARLRARTDAAIIVYTVEDKRRLADELWDLDVDDYVEKYDPPEFVAKKVAALWRRVESVRNYFTQAGKQYRVGEWIFSIGNPIIKNSSGQSARLGVTEHEFVKALLLSEDNTLTVEQIELFVLRRELRDEMKLLQNLKYRLNKKLGANLIENAGPGVYRLARLDSAVGTAA